MKQLFYKSIVPLSSAFKNKKRLTVLAYHTVPNKEKFEAQVKYLSKNYSVISIATFVAYLFNNQQLPQNPLLITFDDGDYSVYENGLPILKKYNMPAVLFVISTLINTEKTFWCRWVEKAYQQEGKTYAEARSEVNRLKKIPNNEREMFLKKLPAVRSRQLNTQELQNLEDVGTVIANHTHTHPMVDKCTSLEISKELDEVREKFKQWGLDGYSCFAYPNGNFNEDVEKLLLKKGIKMAFLFDHKVNNNVINPMRISRIRVNADADLEEFKVKVSGVHSVMMNLKNKVLNK